MTYHRNRIQLLHYSRSKVHLSTVNIAMAIFISTAASEAKVCKYLVWSVC